MAKNLDILPIPKRERTPVSEQIAEHFERSGLVTLSLSRSGDQATSVHAHQAIDASKDTATSLLGDQAIDASKDTATSLLGDQATKEPARQPEKRRKARGGLKKKATVDRVDGRELRKVVAYFPSSVARRLLGFCAVEDVEISRYVVAAVEKALDRDGATKSST